MERLLELDDAACLDADRVGAKAAGLAAARRHGLPVLDGVVVPAEAARPALRKGAEALVDRGSGGARLAVTGHSLDPDLVRCLRRAVADLGPPVIVRSSVHLERDGRWSGAFGSLPDIGPSDVDKAVSSCWASVFRPDTLERLEAEQMEPDELRVAVLIQSQLRPVGGGTARLRRDGTTDVAAVRGPLAGLLSGWQSGARASKGDDGVLVGDRTLDGLGPEVLDAADRLVRATGERLGDHAIEWAWTGDRIVLLQTMPGNADADGASPPLTPSARAGFDDAFALTIARTVHRFGRPPFDDLVLPWALAVPDTTWAGGAPLDPVRARSISDDLIARAWQQSPPRAREVAQATLRELRGPRPERALSRLRSLQEVPTRPAADVVATCEQRPVQHRTREGPGRWEPFLHGVVTQHGSHAAGIPVALGTGAGAVSIVLDPHDARPVPPRSVLVASAPVPALSPRLWRAAALVTTSGSPGAHLFEVARSLGVPAVILPAFDQFPTGPGLPGALMAVDGATGRVAWVPGDLRPVAATTRSEP